MLSVSLIRCKNEALTKHIPQIKSTIKILKKVFKKKDKSPDLSYSFSFKSTILLIDC